MYNEDLKRAFIGDYTHSENTAKACRMAFNAIEKYEIEWNADICTQNADALQPVIEKIVGFRAQSKWMRLIILKDYARWCIAAGVPGACDAILKINNLSVDKIRTHTIANPSHLEQYLNDIFAPTNSKTIDNIYRCYYWLAYSGIKENDILNVKCSDVDFSKMEIKYGDTQVPIYREAVPAFINCIELTKFKFNHPLHHSDTWRQRAPGDTIVRGLNEHQSLKAIRVKLSKISKIKRDSGCTDIQLSYFRAWISGLFYRVYEQEQAGIAPDFYTIVNEQVGDKLYKLDRGKNTQSDKKRRLAFSYLEDYNRWKLAYKK